MSDMYSVSNGVKQGGVLSPILFIMYMDELLCKLSESGAGCHIGRTFCGALGYADDIVLLSPSMSGMDKLLGLCSEFAIQYDVKFNSAKSKLLLFGDIAPPLEPIAFMNGFIEYVDTESHLGHPVGRNSYKTCLDRAITDLYSKTNMIRSHFATCDIDIKYRLFKTYCMPLYGCVLWNYSSRDTERFYVAWRKCVRSLLGVPYTTHCRLLHHICVDHDVETQLLSRVLKFMKTVSESGNYLSQLCKKLAIDGSHSSLCQTVTLISHKCNMPRESICDISPTMYQCKRHEPVTVTSSVIRDLLLGNVSILSAAERNALLRELCVN